MLKITQIHNISGVTADKGGTGEKLFVLLHLLIAWNVSLIGVDQGLFVSGFDIQDLMKVNFVESFFILFQKGEDFETGFCLPYLGKLAAELDIAQRLEQIIAGACLVGLQHMSENPGEKNNADL